jgi:hypothetical protein
MLQTLISAKSPREASHFKICERNGFICALRRPSETQHWLIDISKSRIERILQVGDDRIGRLDCSQLLNTREVDVPSTGVNP